MGTASIPRLQRCWEDWLAIWRIGCLTTVAPWDAALRAFAERADLIVRALGQIAPEPRCK